VSPAGRGGRAGAPRRGEPVAGLGVRRVAGLVGYGWSRPAAPIALPDEDELPEEPARPEVGEGWPRAAWTAAKWAVGGAATAAGAWLFGLVVAEYLLGVSPFRRALKGRPEEAVLTAAWLGIVCGLVVGMTAALRRTKADRGGRWAAGGTGAVGGLLLGLVGGGLAPLSVAAFGYSLPAEVSSTLAWAFAGLLGGLIAYGWARVRREPPSTVDAPGGGWELLRLAPAFVLAVVAVAAATVAVVDPISRGSRVSGAVALAAVGLLAAVVIAVVHNHDRRIRDLERRLREWEEDRD
jgi:hypothetical protein